MFGFGFLNTRQLFSSFMYHTSSLNSIASLPEIYSPRSAQLRRDTRSNNIDITSLTLPIFMHENDKHRGWVEKRMPSLSSFINIVQGFQRDEELRE